ncbi:hypothetical protein H9P43_006770 [Blastocladiella emersonii ATCC 22665]|nr:hypothetical protein H9P43_006770 [Blastocladiella emersonii ATCC 22665]
MWPAQCQPPLSDGDSSSTLYTLIDWIRKTLGTRRLTVDLSHADPYRLHPFLAELVRRFLNWREISGIDAIDAYLERVSQRMAQTRGREVKPATLRQLAPLLVVTVATIMNVGVVAHLSAACAHRAPLQHLYNAIVAALHDQNGMFGNQFAKDACALIDKLRNSTPKPSGSIGDVPRDAHSGLPLAMFIERDE